jgi:hypothetical protein
MKRLSLTTVCVSETSWMLKFLLQAWDLILKPLAVYVTSKHNLAAVNV